MHSTDLLSDRAGCTEISAPLSQATAYQRATLQLNDFHATLEFLGHHQHQLRIVDGCGAYAPNKRFKPRAPMREQEGKDV